jgi:hypothetical protein
MAKRWVLDTETKGTGAQMLPLQKVLREPAGKPARRPVPPRKPRREPAAESPKPRRFKVVDVMTREVLAEGAGTRATVDLLEGIRSIVDVAIYVWSDSTERWQPLSFGESKMLWDFRGRSPIEP